VQIVAGCLFGCPQCGYLITYSYAVVSLTGFFTTPERAAVGSHRRSKIRGGCQTSSTYWTDEARSKAQSIIAEAAYIEDERGNVIIKKAEVRA